MALAVVAMLVAVAWYVGNTKGWFSANEARAQSASVSSQVGMANVERDGLAFSIDENTALQAGDVVTTHKGSTVEFAYLEGKLVALNESSFAVDNNAEGAIVFNLKSGNFLVDAATSDMPVKFGEEVVNASGSAALYSINSGTRSLSCLRGSIDALGYQINEKESLNQNDADNSTAKTLFKLSSFDRQTLEVLGNLPSLCFTIDEINAEIDARHLGSASTDNSGMPVVSVESSQEGADRQDSSPSDNLSLPANSEESSQDSGNSSSNDGPGPDQNGANANNGGNSGAGSGTGSGSGSSSGGSSAYVPEEKMFATIEIRCDTILNNMQNLAAGKDIFVPSNGSILRTTEVEFTEGESVFDVLKRVCDYTGIQLEYSYFPIYESHYIEGINNLYEFDCGDASGWTYKVNGWKPNYGVTQYSLSDGDAISFSYTCDYGNDV